MIDLDETFVFDAVVHSYNLEPANYRNERHAEALKRMICEHLQESSPPGYRVTEDGFVRDWGVEETARMLFEESHTDMATFHPIPLYMFEDGLVSNEKARVAKEKWPNRFRVFAAIDPMRGDEAIEELEKQADVLDPAGLKLYPASFGSDSHDTWRMDDPEVAFPVFERAKDLGIETIAIHKAVPFGPIPRDAFHPGDVDEAAASFPDIDFSIVHGGIAFAEETAWQLARFPNVYVNLDQMGWILVVNERAFAERLATLLRVGGEEIIDRLMWGSGAVAFHPQPQLEAFKRFEFPEDVRQQGDLWWDDELPRLTDEHKRKILGGNYAEFIGIDIEEAKSAIEGDEFDQQRPANGLAQPFSTTRSAGEVY